MGRIKIKIRIESLLISIRMATPSTNFARILKFKNLLEFNFWRPSTHFTDVKKPKQKMKYLLVKMATHSLLFQRRNYSFTCIAW